ncbi:pyridoxal-dependent decarboxylase [Endozoicomonas numazuensis]|uniref:glutamate decarboxylase n=1 Tax=Endozoicomonas numazuensis TaxID=1137799 RepID=A0A081NEJ3_9GAMM|nr:pyridoxal-dependent decarboxylase [Endozoicomonas numazuensis]KEQ16866.1 hypothetical protein GZ78_19595 [Endozoicomonas numazuensis]
MDAKKDAGVRLLAPQKVKSFEFLNHFISENPGSIPKASCDSNSVKKLIKNDILFDVKPELNTSSYVNVSYEREEEEIALMGLKVNLADQTVYPYSYKMHDKLINMIARLWNCPDSDNFRETGVHAGAGTVGSTEACLLAGLALKFRWRAWYKARSGLTQSEVLRELPNIVISTCYQAAWEKLIKYMDIDCKFIKPSVNSFTLEPEAIRDAIDDHTIGVVCIMGNHYAGQYDPVWEINQTVEAVNRERGFQVGIHVDAASGGFIAPFQKEVKPWDFRLNNVLSISASGHKYGASSCGTGWVIWRERKDLSEHVAISVSYLGGQADSYTLNFSRPATGIYVQYYKFLRYGMDGYQFCCDEMMEHARLLREGLMAMTYNSIPRFILLDAGNKGCLPVVAAKLNKTCNLMYNDTDLQKVLSQHSWYVGAYKMQFLNPVTEEKTALFYDHDQNETMFRVVIKGNISLLMVENLLHAIEDSLKYLDNISDMRTLTHLRDMDQHVMSNHC